MRTFDSEISGYLVSAAPKCSKHMWPHRSEAGGEMIDIIYHPRDHDYQTTQNREFHPSRRSKQYPLLLALADRPPLEGDTGGRGGADGDVSDAMVSLPSIHNGGGGINNH